MNNIVIGKRITIGAAITSTATAIAHFFPDHATAIMSVTVPVTFVIQVIVANKLGVTTK